MKLCVEENHYALMYKVADTKKFYYIGFVFALLSGIRLPLLPEMQFIVLLLYIIYNRQIDFKTILLLTTILCTHHYVVPDYVYREDASSYPSIYTRSYLGIKILDILTLFLFLYCLPLFRKRNVLRIFYIKGIPTILLLTSFVGLFFIIPPQFSKEQALFIIRSYLLFFSIFILTIKFTKQQYLELSKIAIFCWILKMLVSILFPHQNPLTRNIMGIDGIIFFAGDEYMTLPLYFAIIIAVKGINTNFNIIYKLIYLIFILTMIAQRKGAIQILIPFLFLVWCYQKRKAISSKLIKIYYVFSGFILFLFLYYINDIISNPLILIAFDEYSNFADISILSLEHLFDTNHCGFLFGISPFGKYEIIGLPARMDHMMSFGKEVGELYRYQFWSFPLGRCILNVGLIGFIYVILFYLRICKFPIIIFFLTFNVLSISFYPNLTPVNAFVDGIVFSFLYNYWNHYHKIYINK